MMTSAFKCSLAKKKPQSLKRRRPRQSSICSHQLSLESVYDKRKPDILAWRFAKEGVVEIGVPGHSTCLYGAMCFASPEIVAALFDAGVDVETTDIMGNDSFMAACGMGRVDNVEMWCSRFKDWKIDKRNKIFGSTALNIALYMGPKKLDLVKYLVRESRVQISI